MSISSSSDSGVGRIFENDRTCVHGVTGLRERRWPMRRLFEHHYPAMRELLGGDFGNGYLVVTIFDNEDLAAHARLTPACDETATLVVGRHRRAQLQLDRDPTVALRHLMVRLSRHDGRSLISIRDLKTGQGFELEGHGRCKSTVSDGPLLVGVGAYTLVFLPGTAVDWPEDPAEAWPRIGCAEVHDRSRAEAVVDLLPPSPMPIDFREVSQITLLPGVAELRSQGPGEALPEETVGVLTLIDADDQSVYPVTLEQLERGLLLGRYSRCDVGSRELRSNGGVSRVHLLIVRDGDRILALDTASTNGTAFNGVRAPLASLGDSATIELGGSRMVLWRRRPAEGPGSSLAGLLN